jgi:hypothetical protein
MNEREFNVACGVQNAFATWEDLFSLEDRKANEKVWDAFQMVEPINRYLRSNPGNELPQCLTAEVLQNSGLIAILRKIGPDYFFSHLYRGAGADKVVEIMKKVTANMRLDWFLCFKSLHGIITKLFVRGKRVKDLVRSTLLLSEETSSVSLLAQFLDQLRQHGVDYFADTPREAETWKVTNMYFWMNKKNNVAGIYIPVEVQIMTPKLFLYLKTSTFHSIYEEMRVGSTYFLNHRDGATIDFLHAMETRLGKDIIPKHPGYMSGYFRFGPATKPKKTDGFIIEKVECNGLFFKLKIPGDKPAPYGRVFPYIVDGSLKVGDNTSFWTEPLPYSKFTVTIEFTTSNALGNAIWVGLGTDVCYHGAEKGESFTVMYGDRCWVRKGIFSEQVFFNPVAATKKLYRGTIKFTANGRNVAVQVPSESAVINVPMATTKNLRICIVSWSGWTDSYIHNVSVCQDH